MKKVMTEEEMRELRFDQLVHMFATVSSALAGAFAHSGADTLLAFLADPDRRRTLRRRAYGFGFVIDQQERAKIGFAKIQPIFALLAATAAEDGVDHDLKLSDLTRMTEARSARARRRGSA